MKMVVLYCTEYSILVSLSGGKTRLVEVLSGGKKRLSGGLGPTTPNQCGQNSFHNNIIHMWHMHRVFTSCKQCVYNVIENNLKMGT